LYPAGSSGDVTAAAVQRDGGEPTHKQWNRQVRAFRDLGELDAWPREGSAFLVTPCRTILNTGIDYGMFRITMLPARKITIEIPAELLEKAQEASGTGITQTVRAGLQLVAASQAYARLRQLRGKVRFSRTLAQLKADR
jgi:hypothetical protein